MTALTWVEPCAGMLAVTGRLFGFEPPIAYMGGKRAYAPAILDGLGLRMGSCAARLVVADAGPPGAFWRALCGPDGTALCDRLDHWAATEPRETRAERDLYERLRPTVAGDPAAWLVVAGWSYRAGDPTSGWAASCAADMGARKPMARLARLARLAMNACGDASVYRDAREIPITVAGRTVVYLDPPYDKTKGYAAGLPRADVIDLAVAWADAGAEVVVSEYDKIQIPGWRHVELRPSGARAGGGGREMLTLSPSVEWLGGEQTDLFGARDRIHRVAQFSR